MKKIVEFKLTQDSVEIEDTGQALIFQPESDEDNAMFIRLQSWDDTRKHEEFNQFVDKNVRVTIEVIEVEEPEEEPVVELKFNRHEDKPVPLYNHHDELLGFVWNEIEFNDIRIQIKSQNVKGYYFVYNERKIEIDPDGNIDKWPDGFFDTAHKQLEILTGF